MAFNTLCRPPNLILAMWLIFCPVIDSTDSTRDLLLPSSAAALIFIYWPLTCTRESRGMEMSELGPDFGLVSTRMVSVLKPGVSSAVPPTVPSRSSEPRISHDVAGPLDLLVSQSSSLFRRPFTQFHPPNTARASAPSSTSTARVMMRLGPRRLRGMAAEAGPFGLLGGMGEALCGRVEPRYGAGCAAGRDTRGEVPLVPREVLADRDDEGAKLMGAAAPFGFWFATRSDAGGTDGAVGFAV